VLALDGAQVLINVSSSPGQDLARTTEVGLGTTNSWRTDADVRPADHVVRGVLQPGGRRRVDLVRGGSEVIGPGGAWCLPPLFDEGCSSPTWTGRRPRERISLPLLRDERPDLVAREWRRLIDERAGLAHDSSAETDPEP
jgi:hypothetical protein